MDSRRNFMEGVADGMAGTLLAQVVLGGLHVLSCPEECAVRLQYRVPTYT